MTTDLKLAATAANFALLVAMSLAFVNLATVKPTVSPYPVETSTQGSQP